MKIISIYKLAGTRREVHCPHGGFISTRFLLESDGMGFTVTRTFIPKGDPQYWHYKNHLEACLCIKGHGKLQDVKTLKVYDIKPGIMYALDKNDAHFFQALKDTVLICVFNPPLKGREVHGKDGSYV
jgi:L-ectoine synthase